MVKVDAVSDGAGAGRGRSVSVLAGQSPLAMHQCSVAPPHLVPRVPHELPVFLFYTLQQLDKLLQIGRFLITL